MASLTKFILFSVMQLLIFRYATCIDKSTLIETIKDIQLKLTNDQGYLSSVLDEIKRHVQESNNEEEITKINNVIQKLDENIDRIQSSENNGLESAKASLDMLLSVSENLPFVGTVSAVLKNMLSGIFSIFTGGAMTSALDSLVLNAVKEVSDEVLVGKINGAKGELTTLLDYLRLKLERKQSRAVVLDLHEHLKKGVSMLGEVSERIKKRKFNQNRAQAEQAIKFSSLYCQLFTMRDIVFNQMIHIAAQSDYEALANDFESARRGRIPRAQETLRFLVEPEKNNGLALTFISPGGADIQSYYIKACLRYFQLPTDPPPFTYPGRNLWLQSLTTPEFVMTPWKSYLAGSKGYGIGSKIKVTEESSGYWTMKFTRPNKHIYHEGEYLRLADDDQGEKSLFNIIQLPKGNVIISPKGQPGFAVHFKDNDYVMIASGGSNGNSIFQVVLAKSKILRTL